MDQVADILSRATISGLSLTLPPEQLDRKTYEAVNDVLVRIGGKWNKKARAHLFATDPAAAIATYLDTGEKPAKNPDAFFATPRPVVERMLQLARLENFSDIDAPVVLEPSAGLGAIANAVRSEYPHVTVHCVEMNEARALACSQAGNVHVRCSDFLEFDDAVDIDAGTAAYDAVLMNPPFAVERDAAEWMAHVRRAHSMLAPHGVLISVVPNSYAHRNDKRHTAFREWAEAHRATVIELPDNSFKESGTGVSCLLLGLRAKAA